MTQEITIDKSWMNSGIGQPEYINGVQKFVEFAISNPGVVDRGVMRCPCRKCGNVNWHSPKDVGYHCNKSGIMVGYKVWRHHGEKPYVENLQGNEEVRDEVQNLVNDAFGFEEQIDAESNINNMTPSAKEFYNEDGVDLFKRVYTPKTGPMSEAALSIMEAIDSSTIDLPPTCTEEERTLAKNKALLIARSENHTRRSRIVGWGKGVTLSTLGSTRSSFVESQHLTEKVINEMKAKWDREKEELLHQLQEKDKLREANEKLMESRLNNLEQDLMNLTGYRPSYSDSMDSYVPETEHQIQEFEQSEMDRE